MSKSKLIKMTNVQTGESTLVKSRSEVKFEKLLKTIEYRIECLPEDTEIRGNLIESDDKEADREDENKVIEDLNNGNQWAWCIVRVIASVPSIPELTCDDYLGACSYQSEKDFKDGGYYDDMCNQTKAELVKRLREIKESLE